MKYATLAFALTLAALAGSTHAQEVILPAPEVSYYAPSVPVTTYYAPAAVPYTTYYAAPSYYYGYYAPAAAYYPAPYYVRSRVVVPRRVYRSAYYW